jgi:hypothetical protein
MANLISTLLPTADAATNVTKINAVKDAFKPYAVSFTDKNKVGVRTMSTDRKGYAMDVSEIATQYPDYLSRQDTPQELEDKLAYDKTLGTVIVAVKGLLELLEDTQIANGIDIMKLVDRYVGSLQNAREQSGELDAAMEKVDEYNKRFASEDDKATNTP